jgi:rare lipoprotein A
MISSKFSTVLTAVLCTAAVSADANPGLSQAQPIQNPPQIATNPGKQATATLKTNGSAPTTANQPRESVVKIHNHAIQGQAAATLYVRNLPILTFLDPPTTSGSKATAQLVSTAAATENSPTPSPTKAETIANQLNQIYRNGGAAEGIKVFWQGNKDSRKGQYVVKAGELPIATIDATTTYAKTTSNAEQDALLVANKLRSLLSRGPAVAPLKQVEGKPKPQAAVSNDDGAWNVTRTYRGEASWYGPGFDGNLTANGERFNQNALTAAHPSLPFGTRIRVTNQNNGRSVVVRVNDRGPYAGGRIVDLSAGSADVIGLTASGVAPVSLEVLSR